MAFTSKRWAIRAVVALTAIAATPLLGGGVAYAGVSGTEIRSTNVSLPAFGVGAGTVGCTGGKVSTGGGFFHQSGLTNSVLVDTNRPGSSFWTIRARNSLSTTQTTTASALCSTVPGFTLKTTTVSLPANGFAETTVTCPSGSSNLGGGYNLDNTIPSPMLTIMWSRPATTGQGWNVRAANGTATARQLSVYATCAPNITGRQVIQANQDAPPFTSWNVLATCPAGKVVTGGGWATGAFDRWLVHSSTPAAINSWSSRFSNSHPSIIYNVITYAVCATGT